MFFKNLGTNFLCLSELKAEVEKLRAAQMSSQGIEPERVRLFQQEITTLKSKLCQQEREMIEANRSVLMMMMMTTITYNRVHM